MEIRHTPFTSKEFDTPELQAVRPGAVVSLPGHGEPNDLLYIKVDKQKVKDADGICLTWPSNCSLLLNPKYGNMRAVDAKTRVRVWQARLDYWRFSSTSELYGSHSLR